MITISVHTHTERDRERDEGRDTPVLGMDDISFEIHFLRISSAWWMQLLNVTSLEASYNTKHESQLRF